MPTIGHQLFADADQIVRHLTAWACDLPDGANIAITGGRLGARVNSAIVEGRTAPLRLWFSDERFLPAGDQDRNDAGLIGNTIVRINSAHGPDLSNAVQESAREYESRVLQALGASALAGAILSIGDDGHIASLFPGTDLLHSDHVGAAAVMDSPKPPPQRVTWTLPLINSAEVVFLLAAGGEKTEVAQRVLDGDAQLPATHARGLEATYLLTCP